jgi:hypothetical protein
LSQLFDSLHLDNEQVNLEDKLVVEDINSNHLHTEHQQQLEDMLLDPQDKFGTLWDIAHGMYHPNICHNLQGMSHE